MDIKEFSLNNEITFDSDNEMQFTLKDINQKSYRLPKSTSNYSLLTFIHDVSLYLPGYCTNYLPEYNNNLKLIYVGDIDEETCFYDMYHPLNDD